LEVPLSAALFRPLNTETSSGFMIALVAGLAAIALRFGLEGGAVGWILSSLCAVVSVLGLARGLAGVPHDIRVSRRHFRESRLASRLGKATGRCQGGASDAHRVATFRDAIVTGSVDSAAIGVLMLFMELAGDDALAEEFIHRRAPVWPAYLYFNAFRAVNDGDAARARELLEQTVATEHPIWATAAAVGLLDRLDELSNHERVEELTDWLLTKGDPAVATDLLFYR
ncbi:MAG: hypothetical protein LC808_34890, partial [Actinobacteria bacterium]|nr:hypothetical protein [Actinomycetota bacterium]